MASQCETSGAYALSYAVESAKSDCWVVSGVTRLPSNMEKLTAHNWKVGLHVRSKTFVLVLGAPDTKQNTASKLLTLLGANVALQALDLLHAAELELLGTYEQPILSSETPLENVIVEPSDDEDVPEDAIVEAANYPGLVPELAALLRANAKVAWLWTEEPSQLTVHKVPKARQLNLVLHRAKACGNPLSTSVDDIPRFMAYFKDVVDYGANHFNLAKRAWAEFAGRAFPDKASFAKKVYASIQATCTGTPAALQGVHAPVAWQAPR